MNLKLAASIQCRCGDGSCMLCDDTGMVPLTVEADDDALICRSRADETILRAAIEVLRQHRDSFGGREILGTLPDIRNKMIAAIDLLDDLAWRV